MAEIGRQLRALRAASGRTVASVASDAGLSVPYIANLENGRGNPTAAALGHIGGAGGMRRKISFSPAEAAARGSRQDPPADSAVTPPSLVRLARTARFRTAAGLMARELGLTGDELRMQLVPSLAIVAAALQRDLSEA